MTAASRTSVTAMMSYTLRSLLRSQRWLPPVLTFALITAGIVAAVGDRVTSSFASACIFLIPIGAWMTVITCNIDDDAGRAMTLVAMGSYRRHQLAKAIVAALTTLAITAVVTVYLVAVSKHVHGYEVIEGVLAEVAVISVATGIGMLMSHPVVTRPAICTLTITAITLAELLIPQSPPVRQFVSALRVEHNVLPRVGVITLESIAVAAILTFAAGSLGARRNR
jgi:hypothetical protein